MAPQGPSAASYIVFDEVSKSFDGQVVLDAVTFDVRRGETLCILGRSGVGKSVALKLMMGFLRPDGGRVVVDGVEVGRLAESALNEIHKRLTMVFQSGALFDSMTVAENVAFPVIERSGGKASEAEVAAAVDPWLEMLELGPYRDRYPDNLSTGMRRAVAIARALAARPQAILYDEPTTMVDPLMSQVIADLIERVKAQVKLTSVVVTHDTRLARQLADRIVMLHESRVRFFGTVAEMDADRDEVVREFLKLDELVMP